jgi:hypothetical protein
MCGRAEKEYGQRSCVVNVDPARDCMASCFVGDVQIYSSINTSLYKFRCGMLLGNVEVATAWMVSEVRRSFGHDRRSRDPWPAGLVRPPVAR